MIRNWIVVWTAFLMCGAARADDAIHVTVAASTQPADFTVEKVKADFGKEIKAVVHTSHGQTHTSQCVSLLSVLRSAGLTPDVGKNPTADAKVKNASLRLVVIVKGHDGYAAVFSLAEMLPEIGKREVWLAIDQDGKSLAERDGPIKLVVPSDEKPGRWVHQVDTISVVDVTAAAR